MQIHCLILVGACDQGVIKKMAAFGVDTSKLECFTRQRGKTSITSQYHV